MTPLLYYGFMAERKLFVLKVEIGTLTDLAHLRDYCTYRIFLHGMTARLTMSLSCECDSSICGAEQFNDNFDTHPNQKGNIFNLYNTTVYDYDQVHDEAYYKVLIYFPPITVP